MLNPFPYLLSFGLISPFLLRITIGAVFLWFGWTKLAKEREEKAIFFDSIFLRPGNLFVWVFGILELIIGAFFVFGFYTQIAALLASLILLAITILKIKKTPGLQNSAGFYFLLLIMAISLLFSGAGFWALDLPL